MARQAGRTRPRGCAVRVASQLVSQRSGDSGRRAGPAVVTISCSGCLLSPHSRAGVKTLAQSYQCTGQSVTEGLGQSDTACRAPMESGQSEADRLSRHAPSGPDAISQIGRSVSRSPAVGQTHHAVLVHQASMKSVFSPTQPDRHGLSGSDGVCGH